jgi:hypothetical protein
MLWIYLAGLGRDGRSLVQKVLELGPDLSIVHKEVDVHTLTIDSHHNFHNIQWFHSFCGIYSIFFGAASPLMIVLKYDFNLALYII